MYKKLFATISLIFLPSLALAHGLASSQLKPWGNYLVEFEYDGAIRIPADEFTVFYVYLLDAKKQPVEFDTAYVKITKPNGATAWFGTMPEASDIKGGTKFGGILVEPGEYTAQVQVTKDGKTSDILNYKFTVSSNATPIVKSDSSAMKNYVIIG